MNSTNKGFVIKTTPELKLKEVITDRTEFDFLKENIMLFSQVNSGYREKMLDFAHRINESGADFDCEIYFEDKNKVVNYSLTGNKLDEDNFLIVGSEIAESETTLALDELSNINNELVSLQRKLTKTNKELEYQREKYYCTLKNIGEGVIVIDDGKNIELLNSAAKDLIGIGNKNIEGEKVNDHLNISGPETTLMQLIKKAISDGESINRDDLILKKMNQEKIPVNISVSPLQLDNSEFIGAVIVFRNISLQKKKENKLEHMAETDKLTNIINRRKGLEILEEQVKLVEKNHNKLTVCFVDVNFLKEINDNHGHLAGDKLLKETAAILNENSRDSDKVIRYGGDEFLIIFKNCSPNEADSIWQRIEKQIDIKNKRRKAEYEISLSRGFAVKKAGDSLTADELIEMADKEMYKQKEKYHQKKNNKNS